MDKSPVPLNGRIVGLALAVVTLAVALRVAWTVVEPLVPALICVVVIAAIYRFMLRGGRH